MSSLPPAPPEVAATSADHPDNPQGWEFGYPYSPFIPQPSMVAPGSAAAHFDPENHSQFQQVNTPMQFHNASPHANSVHTGQQQHTPYGTVFNAPHVGRTDFEQYSSQGLFNTSPQPQMPPHSAYSQPQHSHFTAQNGLHPYFGQPHSPQYQSAPEPPIISIQQQAYVATNPNGPRRACRVIKTNGGPQTGELKSPRYRNPAPRVSPAENFACHLRRRHTPGAR